MIDQHADTEHAHPRHRVATIDDCEAGRTALRYLNGDGPKQPGVFSRLDRLERLLVVGVLVISGPMWWIGWMIHTWISKQGAP